MNSRKQRFDWRRRRGEPRKQQSIDSDVDGFEGRDDKPVGRLQPKQMRVQCLYPACALLTRGSYLRHEVSLGSPTPDTKDVSRSKQGSGVARPQWVKARALCRQGSNGGVGLVCREEKSERLRRGNLREEGRDSDAHIVETRGECEVELLRRRWDAVVRNCNGRARVAAGGTALGANSKQAKCARNAPANRRAEGSVGGRRGG